MASPTISQQIVTLPTTLRLSTCPALEPQHQLGIAVLIRGFSATDLSL
jgi:hypothetical protein